MRIHELKIRYGAFHGRQFRRIVNRRPMVCNGRAPDQGNADHQRYEGQKLDFHGTPRKWRDYPIAIQLCQCKISC
jgi:hypothetical protein